MLRTQVYFDEDDYQMIEMLAAEQGRKKAVVVREVVKAGLMQMNKIHKKKRPNAGTALLELASKAVPGPTDLSEKIDDYLYGELSDYGNKKGDE